MAIVTKEQFEQITYGLEPSSRETYKNGHYINHYCIGRPPYHKLIAWSYHTNNTTVYKVCDNYLRVDDGK